MTTKTALNKQDEMMELLQEGKSFLRYSMVESMKVAMLRSIALRLGVQSAAKKNKNDLVREVFYKLTTPMKEGVTPDEKIEWEKRWALVTKEGGKLNQEQFRCLFMTPLENAFGFRAYWNGKESKENGFRFTGDYMGMSYTSLPEAPVVIRFLENQQGVVRTLVHEYAHSLLHRKGTDGFDLHTHAKEIEAETVAKEVVIRLGVEYRNDWYIPHHKQKYEALKGYSYTCRDEVYDIIPSIVDALWNVREHIKALPDKEEKEKRKRQTKYIVLCPCCSFQWNYKRRAKIIDKDGRGYWCKDCGKEKTYNRLKVMETMV